MGFFFSIPSVLFGLCSVIHSTKELVVDLRRTKTPVTPVSILGHNVDIVEHNKYLGVYIDNKLD